MDTPNRARRSVARKSYRESPVDSPDLKRSTRKSILTKSESPDENKATNTPKASRKPLKRFNEDLTYDLTESSDQFKDSSKAINTPKSAKKSVNRQNSGSVKKSSVESKEEPKSTPDEPKTRRKSTRVVSPENFSPKKLRTERTPSKQALESIVLENSPSLEKLESPANDRPKRERRSKARYSDINLKINLKENTVKRVKELKAEEDIAVTSSVDDESSEEEEEISDVAKPTTLFDDDEDVEGQRLYSFKTPKKKDSMLQVAQTTPKTPQRGTPKTPKNHRLSQLQKTPTSRPSAAEFAKTPRHVRAAIKKKLVKASYVESESDGDFSADASDYEASEDSSSESSEDEEQQPEVKPQSVASRVLKTPSAASSITGTSTRRSNRNKSDYQYFLQSDDYFSTATTKTKTSDHTLDRLKNPRLPHDQLIKLLSNMELSKEHKKAVKDLNNEHKLNFDKWLTYFDEGYTVLLHGLGSKRNLLQAFHKEKLAQHHVMVVNGFFPSLTIKDILDTVWVDFLEMTATGGNPHEVVNMIEEEMKKIPALHIFLIVHNIDGTMLRNDKAQSVLSRLASVKNIHLIASIDHINAPLLWNNTKLSNFNFVWFDVTSFLPYIEETSFENSLLVQNSGALELSSMKSVFQSLTTNARGVYIILVKYQLKSKGNPNYQGMSVKELYSSCREAFLVSSDVALRAQLTEFLDHKLAKMKRTIDGTENITIPIKNILLEQFMNEQS